MGDDLQIRLAREEEAGQIVALIRGSFSRELQNAMIYGCRGAERFISRQISTPGALSDTIYLVAASGDRLEGCVELRWLPGALFLNYICTHPKARGKGLAKKILRESIQIARRSNHRQMHLDVFENNIAVSTWYERLGFRHDYTTEWWDFPGMDSDMPTSGKISGYPHAMVSQDNYGFSMFKLLTTGAEYAIGCMGDNWFRVTQPAILADTEALALLHRIDGNRRILALIPEGSVPEPIPRDASLIVKSWRMTIELDLLLENLNE